MQEAEKLQVELLSCQETLQRLEEKCSQNEELASQFSALASQVTQLAAVAKQKSEEAALAKLNEVIAREQEQAMRGHAAELAKANAVLRGATERLASEPSLEAFVEHVLAEACQEAIESGAVFLYEENQAHLVPVVMRGVNADYPYSAQQPVPIALFPLWSTLLRIRQPLVINVDKQQELFAPDTLAWHRAKGHQGVVVIPLMIGDRPLGMFGIASGNKASFKETELELFQALAQQVTLAVQLTQLAEEAKQAAIAREQEQAARERAAELVQANEEIATANEELLEREREKAMLLSVSQAIATVRDKEDLFTVLTEQIKPIIGFDNNATIFLFDPQYQFYRFWLHRLYQPESATPDFTDWTQQSTAVDSDPLAQYLMAERQALIIEIEDAVRQFPDQNRVKWAVEIGLKQALHAPLQVGGKLLGFLSFDTKRKDSFTEAKLPLVQSVADQVAVAVANILASEKIIVQQAALLQAEQERAAELAKVNEALRRSLNSLAAEQSLDRFLENVLVSLATQFNSTTAEYWSHSDGETAYLELLTWEGTLYTRDTFAKIHPDHPGVAGYKVPSAILGEPLTRRTQHFIVENSSTYPDAFRQDRQWMYTHSVPKEINVPLNVGEKTIGAFVVRMQQNVEITTAKIELAGAFANQVALALELTRLAEEARQAAIAREQERAATERSAELAKANDALKQTVDVLATESNLDRLLSHVLKVIADQFNAPLVEYWFHPAPRNVAYVGLSYWQGQILQPADQPDHPGLIGLPVAPDQIHREDLHQRQRHFVVEDIATDPFVALMSSQIGVDIGAWYSSRRGNLKGLNIPLVLGNQTVGAIGVYLPCDRTFTNQQVELGYALAQQATLAIQLTRLAEEARQTAIAREQERAATERAAELAKANQALKRNLSHLADAPELTAFLGQILVEITQQLGAALGHMFMYDPAAHTLELCQGVRGGQLYHDNQPVEVTAYRLPLPADSTPVWQQLCHHHTILTLDTDNSADAELFWPGTLEWHRQQGHRQITTMALLVGSQPVGLLGLAFYQPIALQAEALELMQALAQQATLAIQLTRLVEQNQAAAIVEERNRMAREIHDVLSQAFTGISIQLGIAQRLLQSQPEAVSGLLEQATGLAQTGLTEAHRSVWALQPDAEEYRALVPALERTLQQLTAGTAMRAELQIEGTPCLLPPDVGLNLLRIGQEAVTNALKYSQAQQLRVELQFTPAAVGLSVRDDGCGFDLRRQRDSGGFGLMGMQQRCERLGGQLSIESQPGEGTVIVAVVPLGRGGEGGERVMG